MFRMYNSRPKKRLYWEFPTFFHIATSSLAVLPRMTVIYFCCILCLYLFWTPLEPFNETIVGEKCTHSAATDHSTADWRRFFSEPPFRARVSSLFWRLRTGRAENKHFRQELWKFFGEVTKTIIKYNQNGAPRGDLKTPGGRMDQLGRGQMDTKHHIHERTCIFEVLQNRKTCYAPRLRTKMHVRIKMRQRNLKKKSMFSRQMSFQQKCSQSNVHANAPCFAGVWSTCKIIQNLRREQNHRVLQCFSA